MTTRKMMAFVVAALLMLGATAVYAGRGGHSHGMGMGSCSQDVSIETIKQFQKETSALRDEMMVKRIEFQRERAKETPDQGKVTALKQEMKTLRTQIHEIGKKHGMFADCDQDQDCWDHDGCGKRAGGCDQADCGKGGGKNCGADCGPADCDKTDCAKQKKQTKGCNSCNKKK